MPRATFCPNTAHRLRQFMACLGAGLIASSKCAQMLGVSQRDQVFGPVVVLDAVDVMHVFVIAQQASDLLLDHQTVFQHVAGKRATAGIRVIGSVSVDVAALVDAAPGEAPVLFRQRLNAVPSDEWGGVTAKVSSPAIGPARDCGALPAAALAQAGRRLVGARDIAFRRRFASMRVAWNEAGGVVVDSGFGLPTQWASAAALANGGAVLVGHSSNLTIGA